MFYVIKYNGRIIKFKLNKILKKIKKLFNILFIKYNNNILNLLLLQITYNIQKKIINNKIFIQDIYEIIKNILIDVNYINISKIYIISHKHKINNNKKNKIRLRQINYKMKFNYVKIINDYISMNDWRVKENSTVNYSIGGLILNNSGAITANYWLSEIYDNEISDAHKNTDIHIHDLSMLSGYCAGWSLKQLINEGISGVEGKITSNPAKHLSVLCNQIVDFLGIMQNEWAGAQAFSSFDTYLSPFVKIDNLNYNEVKKCIESFVYGVNVPSRWGTQAPFSNITLDWTVPNDLSELNAIVGGNEVSFKYKDCKKEMDMINRAFLETMITGDANGRGFQYPIPNYSITKDFNWSNTENNKLLFEMSSKYGTPYFSNYINSDMTPSDVRSMCCRLRLDLRELRKKTGGLFGSGENTGSIGVVTINMPKIAYLSNNEDDFFYRLNYMMDISARSLKIKRNVITNFLNNGLYPYTKRYLKTFKNHFSTIGIVGLNEACLNAKWIKCNLLHKKAQKFSIHVLKHMRKRLKFYQKKYYDLYNLEATPAESSSYRLAKHDKKKFNNIITAGNNIPYYTNSSHLPVNYKIDIFDALDIQDKLQILYTSGTVFHAFLGEKLSDWKMAKKLIKKIAYNYYLPYYTLSPVYSVCNIHGYIPGECLICSKCGKQTEVYSRITGYYRSIKNWNNGKKQEYNDRIVYDIFKNNVKYNNKNKIVNIKYNVKNKKINNNIIKKYLFTIYTCQNCKIAKQILNNEHYKTIDCKENVKLVKKFNIKQTPTFVVVYKHKINKYININNIIKYVKNK